jgi:hypothetical protein
MIWPAPMANCPPAGRPARRRGARHAAFRALRIRRTRAPARRAQGEGGAALPRLHQPRRARACEGEGLDGRSRKMWRRGARRCLHLSFAARQGLARARHDQCREMGLLRAGHAGVEVAFGSLRECVESAVRGEVWRDPDLWSSHDPGPHAHRRGSGRRCAVPRRALELLGGLRAQNGRDHRRAPPAAREAA